MGSDTAPADHLTLHLQIYPSSNADFTDDCVWDLTMHLQITSHCTCRSNPLVKCWFYRLLLWQLILHSYSENSYLADQVLADLPPSNGNFTDSCSDSSYFIPTQRTHIGRPGVGRSTPHQMEISQIPALPACISFLLWELIFGRPAVGRSTPPHQTAITDFYSESSYLADQVLVDLPPSDSSYFIPTLTTHIWQTRFGQIYPPCQMAIIDSYSESSYMADQVLADLPPPPHPTVNGNLTDSCSDRLYFIPTLRAHIWQTRCWQIYPPCEWQFHRYVCILGYNNEMIPFAIF